MKNNFSNSVTTTTSQNWKQKSEKNRIDSILKELKKNALYKNFDVIKAPENGQIVLKIEQNIPGDVIPIQSEDLHYQIARMYGDLDEKESMKNILEKLINSEN